MGYISIYFVLQGIELSVKKGIMLSDAVRMAGFHFDFPCGGHGSCRKCELVIADGETKKTVFLLPEHRPYQNPPLQGRR